MEDLKSFAPTKSNTTTMEHSFVCDDVRQALNQCRPPSDFKLVESHLPSHQKPCAPKYTWADLSVLPEMLFSQIKVRSFKKNEIVSCPEPVKAQSKHSSMKEQLGNGWKSPISPFGMDMDGGIAIDPQAAGSSASSSGGIEGSSEISGTTDETGEVAMDSRKSFKENVAERPSKARPQAPDLPPFLKKFIQQQRAQGERRDQRELRESNRDLAATASGSATWRKSPQGASSLPRRPSRLVDAENSSRRNLHQEKHQGREDKARKLYRAASCLPHSPFKMKSSTMPRGVEDGIPYFNQSIDFEQDMGCFGQHGSRRRRRGASPSPPQPSAAPHPKAEKWQGRSSKGWKKDNAPVNRGEYKYTTRQESMSASRSGLRWSQAENPPLKPHGNNFVQEDAWKRPSLARGPPLDLRESLCDEIKKGVKLRNVATVPPASNDWQPRRNTQDRKSNGGLAGELKERALSLRPSVRQDSDSEGGSDWD